MSTILEALKKSEQERKLNELPTLSDMPVPQEPSRWPLVIIAIMSLIIALMIGVLMGPWFSKAGESPELRERAQAAPTRPVEADAESDVKLLNIIVNVVSYSDKPEQRFVILNGKMFRENEFVRAGLKVEEIKRNAVVLNLRGESVTRSP